MKHFRVWVSLYNEVLGDYIDDFYPKTPLFTTEIEARNWVDLHRQEIMEEAQIDFTISAVDYRVEQWEDDEYIETSNQTGCIYEKGQSYERTI